jgi:hypothetical protein
MFVAYAKKKREIDFRVSRLTYSIIICINYINPPADLLLSMINIQLLSLIGSLETSGLVAHCRKFLKRYICVRMFRYWDFGKRKTKRTKLTLTLGPIPGHGSPPLSLSSFPARPAHFGPSRRATGSAQQSPRPSLLAPSHIGVCRQWDVHVSMSLLQSDTKRFRSIYIYIYI